MATRVFFLSRLHAGVDPAEYEQWVRDVDLPVVRAIPSLVSYDVVRLDGAMRGGEVPYDYIEMIEVDDLETYKRELEEIPDRAEFSATWRRLVGESIAVHGTAVE
jgi:hypothetical protein